MHHTRACHIPGKGVRSPGNGITDARKLPRECWELNPGLLQEQVLLTVEPSLQAQRPQRFMWVLGTKVRSTCLCSHDFIS